MEDYTLHGRVLTALSVLNGTWEVVVDRENRTFSAFRFRVEGENVSAREAIAQCAMAVAIVRRFARRSPAHVAVQDAFRQWHTGSAVAHGFSDRRPR